MRKTKIVCTIGPATNSVAMIKELILAGCNVCRLNFSHGSHETHAESIALIRQAAQELNKDVAILLDTKGPEIRTIDVENGAVELEAGKEIVLTSTPILGNEKRVAITYAGLAADVYTGSRILIDDGLIELQVLRVEKGDIVCTIVNGGTLKNKKGVNVPGVKMNLPGITEKDAEDIVFGIEQQVDFIAASFVRKAEDIYDIRRILERHRSDIHVIAKIESEEGVDNIEEILEVSDGIMVARGDLGVEIPAEDVPLIQKRLIYKCNFKGKPVITATQMLDSMQRNPRPTRAEASDVANAIIDGTDAIMLSGETASGKYPVESVQTMARIAERTEISLSSKKRDGEDSVAKKTITDVISQSVSNAAVDLRASAILAPTESGFTARMISKYRTNVPVIAVTPHERVMRKLMLAWGVYPVKGFIHKNTDEMLEGAVEAALEQGYVKRGDLIVITAGVPIREPGTTNMMKIHVIGEMVAKGLGIGQKVVNGKVIVGKDAAEINAKMKDGAILVTTGTDKDMIDAIQKAKAIITEESGLTSHAAIIGLNLDIPVIVGVENATEKLRDGIEVTIDSRFGHIYVGHAKVL